MEKIYGRYIIENNEIKKRDVYEGLNVDFAIYEVVRAREGHLSFIKEHYERFLSGIKKFSYPEVSFEEFSNILYKLIEINEIKDHNTKIVYEKRGNEYNLLAFLSRSNFPSLDDYKEGIKASILYVEREDPNIKSIRNDYVRKLDRNLLENNSFEAIIVDDKGYVKEGGRSNFFMIKGEDIITVPGGEVLKGIIRSKVFLICEKLNLNIVERDIKLDEIYKQDALFFTGTGKDVLPIRYVNDFEIKSSNNPILEKIIKEFEVLAKND